MRDKLVVKSASDDNIQTIGKVEKFRITIKDKIYFLDALVTDTLPTYTILGANLIKKYHSLLKDILLDWSKADSKNKCHINSLDAPVLSL